MKLSQHYFLVTTHVFPARSSQGVCHDKHLLDILQRLNADARSDGRACPIWSYTITPWLLNFLTEKYPTWTAITVQSSTIILSFLQCCKVRTISTNQLFDYSHILQFFVITLRLFAVYVLP